MTRFWLALTLIAAPVLVSTARSDYASAKRKFDLIESERLKPGSKITLTARELNAYVNQELPKAVTGGVRDPKLELGTASAVGSAMVDFVKLRSGQGSPPGWLMRQLLSGERPVTVAARVTSGGGRATVEVERVEVSGVTIEGRMLDFLIRNYLMTYYPDAKVGQPFELAHNIERLDIKPAQVDVILRK